jgi:UDPglucose 6-dehydrogenase
MKLAMIGTGYVGLVAGIGFSDFGNDVTCVDVDGVRIARLGQGEIPIYEPGLKELLDRNLHAGRLSFSTDVAAAVAGAEAVFIAVGTPQNDHDGAADLSYVLRAAEQIGHALTGWSVIVTKSTVPVGTANQIRTTIARVTDQPFSVASNPEFLKEGDAVNDFMKPPRIVIGVDDERAREVLRHLYAPFVRTNDRIHMMDVCSAELSKYAANAMLATRISFMNELALLAERVGADIERVRRAVGADPRIGPKFLFPGPGFGGSCFPKDVRALLHTARERGLELAVVDAAERANERQKRVVGERLIAHFDGNLAARTIGIWGLSFKPETDDIREAPALVLIEQLSAAGARVSAHDPAAMDHVRAIVGESVKLCPEMYEVARGADALVLMTEWHSFRRPDFERLKTLMREPTLFDARNAWTPDELRGRGFTYFGIGRR